MGNYDYLLKILIIGDSGVGKSCILSRFADNSFIANYISTIGVDFKIKTIKINNKVVKIQIWDTAGQERFRTITSSYYRGAHGIFLVYDVTDKSTFENILSWNKDVKKHAKESVITMLVANKTDDFKNRVVTKEEGRDLAEIMGIGYIETSAKIDSNIYNCFKIMCENILKNYYSQDLEDKPGRIFLTQGRDISNKSKKCC